MAAARLLRPALTIAAAVTLHGFRQTTHTIYLDTPATTRWPQDTRLLSDARKTIKSPATDHPSAFKKGDADIIDPISPPESFAPSFEDDDYNAWTALSQNINLVIDSTKKAIDDIEWSSIGDKITDYVLPSWARQIPELVQKLQRELSMEPGSLADEIWQEAQNPEINPEILWDARVRVSSNLCPEELEFRQRRKERITKALAKYLDIKESEIDPDDVPTIAICGSGGGLRALIAGSSSYLCAQEAGLFDCVTYTAAVSGSCWLQSLFFSSVGKQSFPVIINHLKSRLGTHIAFPPAALKLVTSAPTNKFLLSGWVEKLKGDPNGAFGLVDVYGLLLAGRLLVPKGDLDVQEADLKLSNQRSYLDGEQAGMHPLPIYTLVHHILPIDEVAADAERSNQTVKEKVEEKAKEEAWFCWHEITPYELFCDDFGAGVPTWSIGRRFDKGRSVVLETGFALPEIRQSLLLGWFGSAFCATLSHYRHELQLAGLAGFGQLDNLLDERSEELKTIHPIEPPQIWNFVAGMKEQLPPSCPSSVFKTDHLHLMDAGMSNNLPIYPLLRHGRDVEVLIAFDASADIQKENWLSVVEGYAQQRGIKGWPSSGFPASSSKPEESAKILEEVHKTTAQEAAGKVAQARENSRTGSSSEDGPMAQGDGKTAAAQQSLGPCTVWVGQKEERTSDEEPPPSKQISWDDPKDSTFRLMKPDAGIAVIYFPLLPNDKVPDVNPDKSDYLSTWNFIYTPEQIDKVVALAKANFEEGADQTKRTIRAVYERKKKLRLERQENHKIRFWRKHLRDGGDHFG